MVSSDLTNFEIARSSHCTCWCGANLAFSSGKRTESSWCWVVSFHIPISLWSFHHLYMTHVLPCGSRGPCPEATCALCQRCFTSSPGSCIIPPGLVLLGAQHHSVDVKTAVVFEQFVEVRTWRGVWRGCMRILCSSPTLCHPQVRPGRSNAFLVQVVRPIYKVWWVDRVRQLVHSFVMQIFWRSMCMPYTLGCKFASSS